MSMRQFARQQLRYLSGYGDASQVNGRSVEDAAHGNRHVLVGDVSLFENELEQACAILLLLFEQLFHLPGAQQPVFYQGVSDALAKCFDWRHGLTKSFANVGYEF